MAGTAAGAGAADSGAVHRYMLGVANVLQPDPELGSQATPIARLFDVVAPVVILVSAGSMRCHWRRWPAVMG